MTIRILVDADACPVKEEAVKVADRHGLSITFVSNKAIRLPIGRDVRRMIVSDRFDAADAWIAEEADAMTIVITADIPLADQSLKKDAIVIGPTGRPFDRQSIGLALAGREISRHLREMGETKSGGPSFTQRDRSQFLQALENAVQALKRKA